MLDLAWLFKALGKGRCSKQQLLAFEEWYVFVRSAQLNHSGKGGEFYCPGMLISLSLDKCGVPISNTTKIISNFITMTLENGIRDFWSIDGFSIELGREVTFCHCSTLSQ